MSRHGRLGKANRFTWMLPFAALAFKVDFKYGLKIGWSRAFLGYFFWRLKRSNWLSRDALSNPQWIAVNVVINLNKRSACLVHEVNNLVPRHEVMLRSRSE